MRKSLMNDGHVQLSDTQTEIPMPDGFNAPDNGATCSGIFGRIIDESGHGIEQDEY
jgi:hypothetical protein